MVATRSAKRWFDLTAVRGEPSPNTHQRLARGIEVAPRNGKSADRDGNFDKMPELATTAGAPPLDCWFDEYDFHDTWTLTTQPSRLAHYAMWPPKLAERLILSMCPEWVCAICGDPRRRMTGATYVPHGVRVDEAKGARWHQPDGDGPSKRDGEHAQHMANGRATKNTTTLGWSDCGHDNYQPGTVLDPFAGTGTTLAVAHLHGRDAIGIDIDPRNQLLYPARLDECRRALFGTMPELPGQMSLLEEPA